MARSIDRVIQEIHTISASVALLERLKANLLHSTDTETFMNHGQWDWDALVDMQAMLERSRRELSCFLNKRSLHTRQQW